MNNIDEIFKKNSKLPKWLKIFAWRIKQLLGIVSLYENGICILPYKTIENHYQAKIICKIITRLQCEVVLSKYLETTILKCEIEKNNIIVLDGKQLFTYLSINILEYIAKMKKEELKKQEVTIIINKLDQRKEKQIIRIAQSVKRVQIVTNHIQSMKKIERYLENLGIGILISNNKRKSLLKSNIILNFDYSEEMLNEFNINRKAIVINVLTKSAILSKGFDGINVLDYEIIYDEYEKENLAFKKQDLYESKILNKSEKEIEEMIINDNLKIVNLLGKNGIIHIKEYERLRNI